MVTTFINSISKNSFPIYINSLLYLAEQLYYLPFLQRDISSSDSGILDRCDNCTSAEIFLPDNLPIGGYLHETAFVS